MTNHNFFTKKQNDFTQTTHNIKLFQSASLLTLHCLKYGVYALLLGVAYKAAGIDNGNIARGLLTVMIHRVARLHKLTD